VRKPTRPDDPTRRRPDITLAKKHLKWEPKVALRDGLTRSIEYFRDELKLTRA
jgi:nucleoside-diphosphate-sugar epimerase